MRHFRKITVRLFLVGAVLALLGLVTLNFSQEKRETRKARPSRQIESPLEVQKIRRPLRPRPITDRVLVRFRQGVSPQNAETILQAGQFGRIRQIPRIGVFRVQAPPNLTLRETLLLLRASPYVEYARPDYRTWIFAVPNDPYFANYQYNLRNRGGILDVSPDIQPTLKAGADIKATRAWDETKGDAAVIIAFLDTGVDMGHVELKNKVVSTGGRDFVNGDMDATDDNSHGTWVAGIAAAETNNSEGIAGVAWNCKVLPVKVMDAAGNGYYDELIEGLIWAADNGAKVINISAGGDVDDPALKAACKYAFDKNVVLVAAAGNDGVSVFYPAAYDDYVLAVAATGTSDEHASFSNPGAQVDVAAPGVWVLGPVPLWYASPGSPPYIFGSGTSAAAPQAAGLAALLVSVKPWLTPKQIMDVIRYTADDVNKAQFPGKDNEIGYGRINMERALVPYKLVR